MRVTAGPKVVYLEARQTWTSQAFWRGAALEATQGQMDGWLSQLPHKCYLEEVTFVEHLWEIDLMFALNSTPGWLARGGGTLQKVLRMFV